MLSLTKAFSDKHPFMLGMLSVFDLDTVVGKVFAFVATITSSILSLVLIFNDKPVAGFATFFSTLAAFMAVYLRKTRESAK